MQAVPCRDREEHRQLCHSREAAARAALERRLALQHQDVDSFSLVGYCHACQRAVQFLVDWRWGPTVEHGLRIPNWRERLECEGCKLNNRQRAVIAAARRILDHVDPAIHPRVLLLEQVTPTFKWFQGNCPGVECIGSEYLGPGISSGTVHNGIRHEDVERLSFADESVDLIISNEILEHVNDPFQGLKEKARVLRRGGHLLMTTPLWTDLDQNRTRAHVMDGEVKHLLPPVYHGNPFSDEGSLVFTDFGWELLSRLRDAGFSEARLHVYWSLEYGHLGGMHQFYFLAIK